MSRSGSSSSTWNEMVNASKSKTICQNSVSKVQKKYVTNWKLLIFHLNLLFKLKRKSRFAFVSNCVCFPWVRDFINLFLRPAGMKWLWPRIIPWKSNSPSLTASPETQKWNLKKYDPGTSKTCFMNMSVLGEKTAQKMMYPSVPAFLVSLVVQPCSSEVFWAQPKWNISWLIHGAGKYRGRSIGVYQIHKSHCCSMGLIYLLTWNP